MKVKELNKDELIELKRRYYTEKYDKDASYGELIAIDNLVSDEEIYLEYEGIEFTSEDFFVIRITKRKKC